MDKQIYIYSVDTSFFYNKNEMKIHKKLSKCYIFRSKAKKMQSKMEIEELKDKLNNHITYFNKRIKKLKESLYIEFSKNTESRELNDNTLSKKSIISVFDSTLTRTLGSQENELTTDIIVVQTYFFQILEDLIKNGFTYNNEKYICFTASAGQIRTKKTIFIRESIWNIHKNSLMCGLTIESINKQGGMNVNKFLAYLALCNSATEEWKNFNIDRSIVVNDLETNVKSIVDHIDRDSFDINRKQMDIPITHTDGCGMILPKKSKKSFMCRLPWIKGLLVPFDFSAFAKENESYIVKDIYGKEWDIVKDKIEIIFTKSQFKMWKYYSSWDEYKDNFIKYDCKSAKCNEEDKFPDAKLNYQMIQSLTNITEQELSTIVFDTTKDILNIGNDKETMLRILGVTESNTNKNHTQRALEVYNELLNDSFSKEIIKDKKKSMVKDARAGKINVNGKYTFICPDLYAFCEWLFLGIGKPKGLLNNGEVYCDLYKNTDKLDCLRSPHLYREHAIRKNVIDDAKNKWFVTNGLYTSIHDPISKLLMFDCDGDKSLVCADKTIIEIAEKNMKDIYPLYYEMAVANKDLINTNSIYGGLVAAYKGGNIGVISNDITKVWNSENVNLDVIKWLTMYNNYVIDYAKTLFLPTFPKHIKKVVNKYTKSKVPHFFVYAKDKEIGNVEDINDSTVNKLFGIIPDKRIYFDRIAGKFNHKKLMENSKVEPNEEIISKYEELDKNKKWMMNSKENSENFETMYIYKYIRDELLKINSDVYYVTDVLVKYLYEKNSTRKKTLWESFGDAIVENLKKNLSGTKQCESCGKRIKVTSNRTKYCDICFKKHRSKYQKDLMKKARNNQ